MADISFLLLCFFLMTSSINTDQGIARRLPPPLPPDAEKPEVRERNIFVVKINSKDRLLFNTQVGDLNALRDRAKEFLGNPANDPTLPEKDIVEIPGIGPYPVSKGVISLQNDRGTSFDMYIQVQNELAAAINELRDELSVAQFGKHYKDINENQRTAVDAAIPMAISEAEPTKVGGKK